MKLLETIKSTLPASFRVEAGPVFVALSGGADSVCLLLALREMGFSVEALHCNFELRGTESDADEAFCRRLCRAQGIPLTVRHFRTQSYARRQGISIEMAARDLRYDWFLEEVRKRRAQAVCVAHHRDDSIETMLLNLVRGTGLRGLTGMRVQREMEGGVTVLRPLLNVTRAEIEAWLTERGQTWVTDSTNLQTEASQRNLIRLRLLPIIEKMNARAREGLAETASRLSEAEQLYQQAVELNRERVLTPDGHIDIAALKATPAPQTMLHEILHPLGFNTEQVREIFEGLDGEPGRLWRSESHRLLRDRERLLLEPLAPTALSHSTAQSQEWVLPLEGLFEGSDRLRLIIRRQAVDARFEIPRDRATVCFDLEKLQLPLVLRATREGDRFQPFGMAGTRLVSDFLTDQKLSLFDKERQLVVLSSEHIAWVVGRRAAAGFEVDESTRHVMTITVLS